MAKWDKLPWPEQPGLFLFETGTKPQQRRAAGASPPSTAGGAAPPGHVDFVPEQLLVGKDTAAGVRRFRETTAAGGTLYPVACP